LAHPVLASKLMANELHALASPPPEPPGEHYFQSFHAALASSARGHAFLAEYARRNRHADTEVLLAALDRLETLVRADGAALTQLRDQLHMLLIAIRLARPDIDAASPLTKAAKLANLLDLLEHRIDAMAEGKATHHAPPRAIAAPDPARAEPARAPLSVVPVSDEPELPIPAPAGAAQPGIMLIRLEPAAAKLGPVKPEPIKALPGPDPVWRPIFDNSDPPTAAMMQDIDFIGGPPTPLVGPTPSVVADAVSLPATLNTPLPAIEIPNPTAQTAVAPPPRPPLPPSIYTAAPAAKTTVAAQPADALLAITALSEEERIALFT
jgi:hypothetical protein